eukprot:6982381-Prymnesium_polylepis.1
MKSDENEDGRKDAAARDDGARRRRRGGLAAAQSGLNLTNSVEFVRRSTSVPLSDASVHSGGK